MSNIDQIWNRAVNGEGGSDGDHALSAVLVLHGMVMNGGLLDALESIDPEELEDAKEGFRWLGLDPVADLLIKVKAEAAEFEGADPEALEDLELSADDDYYALLPDDETLHEVLAKRYKEEPDAFDAV